MPEITANGLRFHVRDSGSGPVAILLHGFPDTGEVWRHQVPALMAAGLRVVVPDMRGRGRSERPLSVDDYRLTNVASDVTAILDALGVERAHVVGHDFGAAVAWLVASLFPQRVDRLAVLSVGFPGAAGPPDLEALQKGWYRILIQTEGVAEDLARQDDWYLFRTLFGGAADTDAYIAELSDPAALTAGFNWYRANLPLSRLLAPPPTLPLVRAPTLGMWSSGDLYLTERAMTASESRVTGGWRYERIEDATHWLQVDQPERVNALLLEHLEGR
ncbi:MAG TPA: alpha/beta hydrolase [Candidatus Dormibacteraeota bacterium]|nr:alpha/beta hydrolase [Candidatus Dormibacteraeota bacterium]